MAGAKTATMTISIKTIKPNTAPLFRQNVYKNSWQEDGGLGAIVDSL
jgi:hypothetical protein